MNTDNPGIDDSIYVFRLNARPDPIRLVNLFRRSRILNEGHCSFDIGKDLLL